MAKHHIRHRLKQSGGTHTHTHKAKMAEDTVVYTLGLEYPHRKALKAKVTNVLYRYVGS